MAFTLAVTVAFFDFAAFCLTAALATFLLALSTTDFAEDNSLAQTFSNLACSLEISFSIAVIAFAAVTFVLVTFALVILRWVVFFAAFFFTATI